MGNADNTQGALNRILCVKSAVGCKETESFLHKTKYTKKIYMFANMFCFYMWNMSEVKYKYTIVELSEPQIMLPLKVVYATYVMQKYTIRILCYER